MINILISLYYAIISYDSNLPSDLASTPVFNVYNKVEHRSVISQKGVTQVFKILDIFRTVSPFSSVRATIGHGLVVQNMSSILKT